MIPLEYGFHSTGQVERWNGIEMVEFWNDGMMERKGNIGINDGILERWN